MWKRDWGWRKKGVFWAEEPVEDEKLYFLR